MDSLTPPPPLKLSANPLKLTGNPPTVAITRLAEVLAELEDLGKVSVVLAGRGTNPYDILRLCRNEGRQGRGLLVFACQGELQNPIQLLKAGVQKIFHWDQDKKSARSWLKQCQQPNPPPSIAFEEAWALLEPAYEHGQLLDYVILDATPSFATLFQLSLPCRFFECFENDKAQLFEPMQHLLQQGAPLHSALPLPHQGGSCPVSMARLASHIFVSAQTDATEPPKNFTHKDRFETFSAYSPLGTFEISATGQVLFANSMLMHMLQASSLQQASLWPQRIHPADRIKVFFQIRHAQTKRQGFNLACRFVLPNKKLAWFQVKGAPFLNAKGELISFVGTVRDSNDNTYDKKSYQTDEVLNALPVPVVVKNIETSKLLFYNAAFQNLLGFSKKTAGASTSQEAFLAYLKHKTDLFEQMQKVRLLGNSQQQHQLKLPGNKIRNILSSHTKIHYAGQEALLCTCVDITEAQDNKQQLYSIIQALPDVLLRLSVDGTVLECLSPSNEKRMLNFPAGSRVGKILPPQASAKFLAALLRLGENKKLEVFEYHLEETERLHVDFEVRVTALCKGQVLALIRDVTQSKRFQRELINAREAALLASRAKSQFLANMSHEIRTPINGVLGMIELALSTPLSKEQSDYLYTAKTSGQTLLSIIADILDLSKIEADKLDIESIAFSLELLLSETCNSLAHRAREKNLELVVEMVPGTPDNIVGDPTRLRQILNNLIANSIKFTSVGEVFVQVSASQESSKTMLSIAVCDTGVGIPKSKLNTIFDAFTQADGSITRRFGGTGLGLTITKQLVEKLGGNISVNSQPNVGTCFRVHLPLGPSPHMPAQSTLFAGKTCLLLEANTTARWVLKRMLEQWGMEVLMPNTSIEAIALLLKPTGQHPGLFALVDNVNPHHAFLQWLEKNRPDFPLVLLLRHPQLRKPSASLRQKLSLMRPVFRPAMEAALRQLFGMLSEAELLPQIHKPSTLELLLPLHILVAEDNPINAKLARALLEKQGNKVTSVANGLEAVRKTREHAFHVVIMDVQMPEMDGIAATQAIRAQEKTTGGYLPIIALTANAMKGDNEACLQAGMDAYLTKPLQKAALNAALRKVLSLRVPPLPPL